MAEATKTTVTVQKPVQEERIVLTLTREEAADLLALTGKVAGSFDGPRKSTDAIYSALSPEVLTSRIEMTNSGSGGVRIEKATA